MNVSLSGCYDFKKDHLSSINPSKVEILYLEASTTKPMLPFFRKIRLRLARDNQFFKYSRYAIGEILLVVIGILIALQINNWNTEKDLRNQELETFQVIKSNIAKERLRIEYIFSLSRTINEKIDSLLAGEFNSQDTYEDIFYLLTINMPHHRSNSGYLALVNGNMLNNISNKELQSELTYFYDNVYERIDYYSKYDVDFSFHIMEKYLLKTLSNEPIPIESSRIKELLKDPYFTTLLRQCKTVTQGRMTNYEKLALPSMQKIETLINQEINK